MGGPTLEAMIGQKLFPGLLDHYLARTGYKAQQTSELENPARPDDLWAPVDDTQDHGSHGSFDYLAKPSSDELWLNLRRSKLIMGSIAAIGVLYAAMRESRSHAPRHARMERAA